MAAASLRTRRLLVALIVPPLVIAALWSAAEGALSFFAERRPRMWDRTRDEKGVDDFVQSPYAPIRAAHFRVPRFAVEPAAGTRRVICLGDSTMYGHPFDPPVPFASWLDLRLKRLLPSERIEVLNLGASGMCSENVLDTLRELDGAGAEMLIVYVGHNEFVDMNLMPILEPTLHWFRRLLRRSRVVAWLAPHRHDADESVVLAGFKTPGPIHDAPLFTPEQIERALRNYRDHLAAIVDFAHAKGMAVVLCRPIGDALDTPPHFSNFAAATPESARAPFNTDYKELRRLRRALESATKGANGEAAKPDAAALADCQARLDRLAAIDPSVALLHYERGRLLRLAGRMDEARAELAIALDVDAYPTRLTRPFGQVVLDVGRERGALVVDPAPLFDTEAAPDLPGQNGCFVDYVHPDVRGHELVADAILHALADASLLAPKDAWRFADEPTMEEYRKIAGYRPEAQADTWARDALFLIGESLFDARNTMPLEAARGKLEKALELDADCAAGHLGLGVIAAIRKESDAAFEHLEKAAALDPAVMKLLADPYEENPEVRKMFAAAGLELKEGRVQRIR